MHILSFITGENEEVLAALEGYRGRDPIFDQGLDELGTVVKYLGSFGVPADHFAVDLTIARGLDYYTGTVYETVMLDHPEIGSICSGGRYDNLAEYYTDKKLPGRNADTLPLSSNKRTMINFMKADRAGVYGTQKAVLSA